MADDESTPFGAHSHGRRPHSHGVKREDTHGSRTLEALANISQSKQGEKVKRSLELGLEAAESITDRTISLFSRGHQPAFAGINTFMKAPYCEDIRKVGDYEAAFVGIPFDSATTYRSGTRFGPQAVRRISALYDGYWFDGGVDLYEELDLLPAGLFSIRSELSSPTSISATATEPGNKSVCRAALNIKTRR